MGISSPPEKLLNLESVKAEKIPVIKRFSGGGTVIVDENTLFVTFIIAKEALDIPPFPEPILRWTENVYKKSWQIPHFQLRENDYCIGDLKCGGNAQYIKKDRWLHHTSFLWDYSDENMRHLLLPTKRPKYRLDRSHSKFLTRLKNYTQNPEVLIANLKKALEFRDLDSHVKPLYIADFDLNSWVMAPHRKSTQMIEL